MSTSFSPNLSHSLSATSHNNLRKRSPTLLSATDPASSLSPSIYSPEVEVEDVIRFDGLEGVAKGEGMGEEVEEFQSVRLVEDDCASSDSTCEAVTAEGPEDGVQNSTGGGVDLERNVSTATLDRPYLGRSISYLLAPFQNSPSNATRAFAPAFKSAPFSPRPLPLPPPPLPPKITETPLTTPGRSILMSRMDSRGSGVSRGSRSSVTFSFETAPSRPPPSLGGTTRSNSQSRSVTTMGERSFSSYLGLKATSMSRGGTTHSSSGDRATSRGMKRSRSNSNTISSSVRFVHKFPDKWYERNLWRRVKEGVGLGIEEVTAEGDLCYSGEESEKEFYLREGHGKGARWKLEKWLLLGSVASLFSYGIAGFLCSLVTWFRTWPQADVVLVTDTPILIALTLSSLFCLLTSLIGLTGTILNSRPILALYTFLLWPVGIIILLVGYWSYKKETLSLDLKLNQAWSQWFDDVERLRVQDSLHCCGYYSPYHEATFSKFCYPRTSLPGCKGKLYRFEKMILHRCWLSAFIVAPLHIVNIFVGMLCSNHVNSTFGKGLMPRAYRLSPEDVQENALAIIRSLPSPPSIRRSSTMSKSSSTASTLSFMPTGEQGAGLAGLGVLEIEEEAVAKESL